ncbi:MAG: dihydrolipoyl dehydrogenase [Planctomycetota bacterium]|jgi:dihydrolipoamide dehydrogenase
MADYDIIIIGSGPGGYVAAARAGQLNAKVAVVEADLLGGTCLNRGCIPTKTLIASARVAAVARSAGDFGVAVEGVRVDYAAMAARKDKVVKILRGGIDTLLSKRGVEIIYGKGSIAEAGVVTVTLNDGGSRTLSTAKAVIATGSEPAKPGVFKFDGEKVLTSQEAVERTALGKSVIIVGAGYIGCEYAALYANLGLDVTVLELLDAILVNQDGDVIKHVLRGLKRRKVKVHTGVKVTALEGSGDGARASLEDGRTFEADFALVAVGRKPVTDGLHLERAGVKTTGGYIEVDDHCLTSAPWLYAIGDVTGKMQLAHVASAQGVAAVEHALGQPSSMDYNVIPSCIFTDPEAASVGITEEQARERGIEYKVGRFQFRALGKSQAEGHLEGLVKLIGEASSGKLLGAHIVGAGASDMIAEAALAMRTGATADDIIRTIHAHPTLPEAFKEAAEDTEGRAIHVV